MRILDALILSLAVVGGAAIVYGAAYLIRSLWTIATSGWRR